MDGGSPFSPGGCPALIAMLQYHTTIGRGDGGGGGGHTNPTLFITGELNQGVITMPLKMSKLEVHTSRPVNCQYVDQIPTSQPLHQLLHILGNDGVL